ncbi:MULTISPECIES: DsbA family protein [unclassified Halorhabdus]|uniref:DsbA family protein n=1 Tax=unclassified Halorhabdus TaxID=2621901 RepID=UPI00131BCBA8|nr:MULTISPECIES: DsbA family protein [unclassified Halorhabdus]
MDDNRQTTALTRRRLLAAGSVAAVSGVAGCSSGETTTSSVSPSAIGTLTETASQNGFPETAVELDGDRRTPIIGDLDADITVRVFENYQCGHCARYSLNHFPAIREEYIETGTIRYAMHDLPFSRDGWEASRRAPHAARAVWEDAGHTAFWEYSQKLFANQDTLGPETYARLAKQVGADPDDARSAAANRRYEAAVSADVAFAEELGVDATPTAFVVDTVTDGYDFETVSAAIEDAKPEANA